MKKKMKTMSRIQLLLTAVLLVMCQAVMAQGHRVSGTVVDAFGPVMGANVTERDANNRIVTAAVTDINGNYSMVIANPKNKLVASFVGNSPQTKSIGSQTKINFNMQAQTQIKEVTVVSKRRTDVGGLGIPKREMSVATQTMDFSEVEGMSFASAGEALQGQIAGLDIVAGSGNAGAGTQMRLRGVSSINGDKEPLIVLDGQIFDAPDFDAANATEEDYSSLLSINVEDIASITVLKDAASTAVWGSQGANGVIEIKTKRGARGKTKVNYSYKFTGTWQPTAYKLLNGDQYTMMLKEELYNQAQDPTSTSSVYELNYDKANHPGDWENWNNNTDWVDAVTQFGQRHEHNIQISGGGEKATFRISAGYNTEKYTIIKQSKNMFTTRMALDYNVSDRIKFRATFPFTYTNFNKNYSDLLPIAQKMASNMSIYRQDADGNDTHEFYIMNSSTEGRNRSSDRMSSIRALGNPVAIANLAWREDNTYRVNPDFQIVYELMGKEEGKHRLTYTGDVYIDIYARSTPAFYPAELTKVNYNGSTYNHSYNLESNRTSFTIKNDVKFVPHFKNEDWSAMGLLRYEMQLWNSNQQTEGDYILPNGIEVATAGAYPVSGETSTLTSEGRSQKVTFNSHFSYKSKYSLGITVVADGNSSFGPKNKWAYSYGLSGRWNIIDEPFMQWSRKWLSMLAFSPGWGQRGKAPGNTTSFYELYVMNSSNYGPATGSVSAYPVGYLSKMRIDDLKRETKTGINLKTDVGLFNDRIEAEISYYNEKTTDLMMNNVKIPSSSGYSIQSVANVGAMTNEGWEMSLNFNNIIKVGKFSMSAKFNMQQNYNEVTEMDERVLAGINTDWSAGNGIYLPRVQVGNPLGSIYGYRYKGVYQYGYEGAVDLCTKAGEQAVKNNQSFNNETWYNQWLSEGHTAPFALDEQGRVLMNSDGTPKHMVYDYDGVNYQFRGGDAIYEDINHDGDINQLDVVYLGNSLPKFDGGFGFTFKYDRWKLTTQFTMRLGYKVVNAARMELEKMSTTYNQTATVNYRWRKDGDETPIPRALYGDNSAYNWLGSDRYVEDGSFLRFNYAQLSYDAPTKWVKSVGLSSLKVYVSANNLYCWTKYSGAEPERSSETWKWATDAGKTARPRTMTVGINLGL